ncbi:MAG: hypothetical protein EOP53_00810 [Sphingobacteriales bacterium]|nr:MAG: hypothetical protein EOP53_00810 [Sphingobacteriales bacterium]
MHICRFRSLSFAILLLPYFVNAQDSSRTKQGKIFQPYPVSVSVFSNASALPTSPGQIFEHMHPGLDIGTSFRYNRSEKHQLAQTVKLGFFYHRFVQSAVQLYSEFAYRYELKNGLGFDALAGAGYVHSIPNTEILELNDQGVYEKKTNLGKPEIMGSFAIGAGYTFNKRYRESIAKHTWNPPRLYRIFINYQFWLQTPFINSYVPVLPNTALHLGFSYPLHKYGKI